MTTGVHQFQHNVGGRALVIETGKLAGQADGSVTVRYGDSLVLVTACASAKPREGVDFLPLTVDYEERLYAAGKIPGSFFRREGRPTQEAILAMRLTDRSLRPLFPKGYRNETQVIITVLSADQENDPDILAIIGASAALSISGIPFEGPVSATRIGYIDGEFVVNPTFPQLDESKLDLVVVGTRDALVMVEAGVKEVDEGVVIEAVRRGQEVNQEVIRIQDELVARVGKPRVPFSLNGSATPELEVEVEALINGRFLSAAFTSSEKGERNAALEELKQEVVDRLGERYSRSAVEATFEALLKREIRNKILTDGVRTDGRSYRDIRSISCEVGILPRAHGSGLFARGQTQVITIATLGSVREEQRLDTISPEESKRFMHHYNFPPYSVGEVRRMGGPGRREIGHGALAERALLPMIPDEEEFPYTIRLVSEVVSSNGSTSMASVCGSTLALMDAGVPIKAPVAGIAMGLIMAEDNRYAVLTDIQGMEDHLGDMDFKVAGTAQGITALQMDIKVKGITDQILEQALGQAREARLFILERMQETIGEARAALSPYAPRMIRISIPVEKIGAVIGPGGKTIRAIIEETNTSINVENDGTVTIGSVDEAMAQKAVETIESLTREVEVGALYTGKVTRLMSFGAFVEILPGKEGLVHISELADFRVPSVEDVVKVGDEIMVVVTEVDAMGRVNLSRRAVFADPSQAQGAPLKDSLTDRLDAVPQEERLPTMARRPSGPPQGPWSSGPRGERRPGGPPRNRGFGGPPVGPGGPPRGRGPFRR